jgi:hypothetical protein
LECEQAELTRRLQIEVVKRMTDQEFRALSELQGQIGREAWPEFESHPERWTDEQRAICGRWDQLYSEFRAEQIEKEGVRYEQQFKTGQGRAGA